MKKNLLYLLFLFIFICSISFAQQGQHGKYYFYPLIGRAILSRTAGANWLPLQKAQPVEVKPGDMINVEGSGKGELHFPDGSIIRIKNNAMITIARYGISLRLGYAWFNIRRSTDTFVVATPLGSCSVLGTSFDVEVDQFGKSLVRVFEGIVAVKAAESELNRQLVLQAGMKTNLNNKTKVANKPDKFGSQTIAKSIASEWEPRQFINDNLPIALQPTLPPKDMSNQATLQAPSQIPTGLPIMRQELQEKLDRAQQTYEYRPTEAPEATNFTVRQRSEFQEMLMQRQLSRDSVIGGYTLKNTMEKDGHALSLGESNRARATNSKLESTNDYRGARNRLLRVQGEITQLQMQINGMINENKTTLTQQRQIREAQNELVRLQQEHRFLQNQLRNKDNP